MTFLESADTLARLLNDRADLEKHQRLAEYVAADIATVSPETAVSV